MDVGDELIKAPPSVGLFILWERIMLAGVFIQNYKCYSNINFIPLTDHPKIKLNIFIGPNGAGKSAILESLNCIFNNIPSKDWETTIDKQKDRTSICPVFLIKKDQILGDLIMEAISECLWNYDFSPISNADSTKKFIKFRDELKLNISPQDYYLLAIGKNYEGDIILTTTFNKKIIDQSRRYGNSQSYITLLYKKIINRYNYVYIPIENKISDMLQLQAQEMQSLMDKSLIDEIKKIFELKKPENSKGGKAKSLLDLINEELNTYTQEINQKLIPEYEFNAKTSIKKTIKASDIIEVIFKEYFQIRPLTKDGKHIRSLSSGQQRLALIDVATTLLSTDNEKTRDIILAIDEPENSLEASNCYEQFDSLLKISTEYNRQLLITTHWYGLLLNPSKGQLTYIEPTGEAPQQTKYPLHNIHEQRRAFPNSIEMKSYFDLMSAMLSILKKKPYTWIVCEGSDDARHLKHHLKPLLTDGEFQNLICLPFNGSGNIKKLFDLLTLPFTDEAERKTIKGKVICLIDNDEKNPIIIPDYKSGKYGKKLQFYRLHLNREHDESSLISVANPDATNTVFEDTLDCESLWMSLAEIAKTEPSISELFTLYKLNTRPKHADLTKFSSFLEPKEIQGYERKAELLKLLSTQKIKQAIASSYPEFHVNGTTPDWILSLKDKITESCEHLMQNNALPVSV